MGNHHLKAQPCASPTVAPMVDHRNASPRSPKVPNHLHAEFEGQDISKSPRAVLATKTILLLEGLKGKIWIPDSHSSWVPSQPMHWGIPPFPIHLKCSSVSAGSDFHHISTFANSRNQRRQWNQAWRGKSAARHVWLFKGIRVSPFPEGLQFLLIKSTRLW